MKKDTIEVGGIPLPKNAAAWAKASQAEPAYDVLYLEAGFFTKEMLLDDCLEGEDPKDHQAIYDYVDAICRAAKMP